MLFRPLIVSALLLVQPVLVCAESSLAIFPPRIELTGKSASQRFLVQQIVQGHVGKEVTDAVTVKLKTDGIASIVDGRIVALGEGQTHLVATDSQGKSAEALVVVRLADAAVRLEFDCDVQPVLAKAGCNSGACHGALAGKGGFRLSLLGYDSQSDYFNISQQARGRRLELADPGRSLFIAKPSGMLPHKGGVKLPADSDDYQRLLQWIVAGAPGPREEDAPLERIEVFPSDMRLTQGDTQQLVVCAHYQDGRIKDVTPWVRWSSTQDSTARVDDQGQMRVTGPGVGAVTAWFASRIVIANVTVPYPGEVSQAEFERMNERNFIDHQVLHKLRVLNMPPSERCSDTAFLRRAYLDTTGSLPDEATTVAFLQDHDPNRRDKLIEKLLASPEFVDYWAYRVSDLMLVNGTKLRPAAVEAFYRWIRQQVEDEVPWDELVRRVLTASGSSIDNGATNFYAIHQTPEDMTENASQAFLGLSIACARCHNHPLEKWTNDQYYAMANLFARVRAKGWGGDSRNGDGRRTLVVLQRGDLIQPNSGAIVPPAPLDSAPMDQDDPADRRVYLADWLTSPENPYFTRSIANRIWANFFDVALVESVDDMRVSNPPSNQALLDALAQYLVDNRYDMKSLMRVILQSETYQRSSAALAGNAADKRFYSHYYPRRLMAEVLLDAISDVTAQPTAFTEIEFPGADKAATGVYPLGTRAMQLHDSAVSSYFLRTFGRNSREITCECQRSNQPSVVQMLHLSNGTTINQKLAAPNNRIGYWIDSKASDPMIIEQAFLTALNRLPQPHEIDALKGMLAEQPDRREAIEDLLWSIMSSTEFLYNH